MIQRQPALLVLEDGIVFNAHSVTGAVDVCAEFVFNTAMTGYQEIVTDPSYYGQAVVMTYPLIGNTGVNREDVESSAGRPWVSALVMREMSPLASNWRASEPLDVYLRAAGVPAIDGVDTRALVFHLREHGALRGCISTTCLERKELQRRAAAHPSIDGQDLTQFVTRAQAAEFPPEPGAASRDLPARHIAAIDFGMKENIRRMLQRQNFRVTILPAAATAADVLAIEPDGLFLSNGPGDPAAAAPAIAAVRELVIERKLPTFGICLGHQILGLALGGRSERLRFGHHGANHPVKNLRTGEVEITSQNHNYVIDPKSLDGASIEITHINLNDDSLEGFAHRRLPAFAIQYHPEAAPGPHDSWYLFERFRESVVGSSSQLAVSS